MKGFACGCRPAHPCCQAAAGLGGRYQEGLRAAPSRATVFPSEQLGKAFDHYDMARDGIADFTYVNPGYQPGRFPIIGAGELPFLFSDGKGGSAAIDAWYRKYAAEGDEGRRSSASPSSTTPGSHSTARKKIVLPDDIKGMKIRPAHEHHRPDGHLAGRHQRAGLGARGRATCWSAA